MTVAVCVRVSSRQQKIDSQEAEFKKWLAAKGIDPEMVVWFIDKETGKPLDCPAFKRLQGANFDGTLKTVVVWKLDRLCRLRDGVYILADWCERGLRVIVVTQQIDLSRSVCRMIAAVMLGLAEIELEFRRERQAAGKRSGDGATYIQGRGCLWPSNPDPTVARVRHSKATWGQKPDRPVLGDPQGRVACYNPPMANLHETLTEAVRFHQAGNLPQAEQLYREVLRADPRQADALNLLGVLANQVGRADVAIDFIRQALVVQPGEATFHGNLAAACTAAGDVVAAISNYQEALRLNPHSLTAHVYLSDALMEQGGIDEALTHCREALRLDPNSALAWCALGELAVQGHCTLSDADVRHLQGLLAAGQLGDHDASLVHFTLAALQEKQGHHDLAFHSYRQANELKRNVYRQSNQLFDPHRHRALIDSLITVFTPEFFSRTATAGSDSEQPVFVVGMVRSGTSLVEHILASHPAVFGAGELKDVDQMSIALPGRLNTPTSYPACLAGSDLAAVRTLADMYLQRVRKLSGGTPLRIIDKMPHNYLHLGLIAVLFPKARIIHCRRHPLDVCVSAYCQNFKWLSYASSLEEIGFYHVQYERLMWHWQRVLPLPMREAVYEEMVANQEAVSRDLVAFCGLDWDDRCLTFHNSPRVVQTASKLQVRQPIYTRSVARWKRFEAYLEPLRTALAAPADGRES